MVEKQCVRKAADDDPPCKGRFDLRQVKRLQSHFPGNVGREAGDHVPEVVCRVKVPDDERRIIDDDVFG
jgi:hypothetical protein